MTQIASRLTLIGLFLCAIAGYLLIIATPSVKASVGADAYFATTTQAGFATTTAITPTNPPHLLGSVVITGTSTATIAIYDATTSDSSQRKASMATSNLRVATFQSGAAAGTYTFDVNLNNGLLISLEGPGAVMPTSTITYRY